METILKTENLCKYYGKGENGPRAGFLFHCFPARSGLYGLPEESVSAAVRQDYTSLLP